ncbi:MAG: O-antigen ligase family protein [Acidobacteriota bacterium]
MSPLMLAGGLALISLLLPNRALIVLSVLGVMLADTPLVPKQAIYFTRFVPSGVLALRAFQLMLSRGTARSHLVVKAWLPFILLSFVSVGYSIDSSLSTQRLISAAFLLLGFGIGIPLFFPRNADHQGLVRLIALLLGSAVLYSLYVTTVGGSSFDTSIHGRTSGVFRNPNTLGLMAMQAAFLVAYWWQKETGNRRRLLFVALFSIIAVLLLTGSRASALGLAVGAIVYVRLKARLEGRILRYLFQLSVLALVAFVITDAVFPSFLDSLLRVETSSRTILWERAWVLAQDRLLLGVGFAASDSVFQADVRYLQSIGVFFSGPHSSLMRLLVDLGLIGVVLAIWAFFRILHQAWRYMPYFDDPLLGTTLYASLTASLTNSLFESWLFGFGSAPTVPFWLLIALLSHQTDVARQKVAAWQRYQAKASLVPMMQSRGP